MNDDANPSDREDTEPEEVLDAFNARDVIDHAGEPPREVESPANEADAPAPPG